MGDNHGKSFQVMQLRPTRMTLFHEVPTEDMKGNIVGVYDASDERPYHHIYINGELLDPKPSQKVYNHSPDGFNWGYGGSGAAQCALGICLHFLPEKKALSIYQQFKWAVIANLEQGHNFTLKVSDIKKTLHHIVNEG